MQRHRSRSISKSSSRAGDRPSTSPGALVGRADIVIPRIGASITNYGLAVVRQFDMMGVPVLNTAVAIARSRDKLRALQLLTRRRHRRADHRLRAHRRLGSTPRSSSSAGARPS